MKRWGIGLAIGLGALLIVNGILSWRVETRFNSLVADIREEGDPASIAELKPAPVPAEENAAAQLDKLTPRLREFEKEYGRFYTETDLGRALNDLQEGKGPSPEQIAAMREILARYEDLHSMVEDAAACPRFASTADFSLTFNPFLTAQTERVTRIRMLARMIDWRSEVLVAEGKLDEAAESSLTLLRLARLHEAEPVLLSYLVTVAVRGVGLKSLHRALATGPVAAETRLAIEDELARQDRPGRLGEVLRTERALNVSASREQGWDSIPRYIGWLVAWPIKRHFIGPLELHQRLLPLADRPWAEVRARFDEDGSTADSSSLGVMAELLAPAFEAAFKAHGRDLAMIRSMRIFNSLGRFATEHGRQASGPEELELPAEATTDPFTGQSLIVRHTDAGWFVYSVADNGIDDGGDFADVKDYGVGPKPR